MANILEAFAAWNMASRAGYSIRQTCSSAVLERHGDRRDPLQLRPCSTSPAHHRYEPRPVAVARGNEKGRVERAISGSCGARSLSPGPSRISTISTPRLIAWCRGQAADRRCPEDHTRSVAEVFAEEAPRLLALPGQSPSRCRAGRRQGRQDTLCPLRPETIYSVPHSYVRRPLIVLAADTGSAAHRSTARRSSPTIGAVSTKAGRSKSRPISRRSSRGKLSGPPPSRDPIRLAQAAPSSRALLVRAAERGANLGSITASPGPVAGAATAREASSMPRSSQALERDVPHPNAVRLALERRRDDRQQAPPRRPSPCAGACPGARQSACTALLEIYDQCWCRWVMREEP